MGQSIVAALIEEPLEVEYRCGMFYISDASGVRAIRPHVFLVNFRRCAEAIQDYHAATGAAVVQFPAAGHG